MGTSTRDFVRDFQEQWRFLHASMRGYDAGDAAEAKRIAVTIRTLVHDTQRSTSLLKHLDLKDKLWFVASGGGVNPANQAGTTSLTGQEFTSAPGMSAFRYVPTTAQMMVNDFDNEDWDRIRPATFEDWWTCPVIRDLADGIFCRRDLVLLLANKDGGAHVDHLLPKQAALKDGLNYGWGLFMGTDEDNVEFPNIPLSPVEASVRTIATELNLGFYNQRDVLGFEFEGEPYVEQEPTRDVDPEAAVVVHYGLTITHTDEDGNEVVETLV